MQKLAQKPQGARGRWQEMLKPRSLHVDIARQRVARGNWMRYAHKPYEASTLHSQHQRSHIWKDNSMEYDAHWYGALRAEREAVEQTGFFWNRNWFRHWACSQQIWQETALKKIEFCSEVNNECCHFRPIWKDGNIMLTGNKKYSV